MGKPGATDEEAWQAARQAQADTFISELEDIKGRKGLDAHVGERGGKAFGWPATAGCHCQGDVKGCSHPDSG